jgi:hypothetical protein
MDGIVSGEAVGPEQCRLSGAECLMLAQSVTNDTDRVLLLHMADAWRRLAERIESQSAPKGEQTAQTSRLGPLK